MAELTQRASEAARRRPKVAVAAAVTAVLLLAGLGYLVIGGGSSNGLASSYTCTGPNGLSATINITAMGSTTEQPYYSVSGFEGTITNGQGAEVETFSHGYMTDSLVQFAGINDPTGSGNDYLDLSEGGSVQNGNLVLGGGQVTCTP